MRGVFFILLSLSATLLADRCSSYKNDIRKAQYFVWGVDFPYHYSIGQVKQESGCRDVISNDGVGSKGLPQITYRIWQKYLDTKGIHDIDSISNQFIAQAWIMKDSKSQAFSYHMWVWYQVYNGGGAINKEIKQARKDLNKREISHNEARPYCKRKTITFSNGEKVSACDINYEYSEKIYEYAQKYKLFSDGKYIFW